MKTRFHSAFGRIMVVAMTLLLMPSCSNGDVEINEKNFPDENFRAWLLEQDYGQDSLLTKEKLAAIDTIDVYGKEIKCLGGIEFFSALKELRCWYNNLTELDLSGCTELESLNCQFNQLTALNLSGCSKLDFLECYKNQLTSLDLSQCKALEDLHCEHNKLAELNVSGCSELAALICYDNQLTKLDLAPNLPKLRFFQCQNNQLTELDLSQCPVLAGLDCQKNKLTKLNLAGCKELTHINCSDNQLAELDPSPCPALFYLNCSGNNLAKLDLTPFTELNYLVCANNQLDSEAMGALIESLRKGEPAESNSSLPLLCLFSDDEAEKNVCTKQQLARGKAKGWKLLYMSGGEEKEYEGASK